MIVYKLPIDIGLFLSHSATLLLPDVATEEGWTLLFRLGLAYIGCFLVVALFWSNFVARRIAEERKVRSFEITPQLIQVSKKIIGTSLSLKEIRDINRGVIDLISGMIVTRHYSLVISQIEDKDNLISDKICDTIPILGLIYKFLPKSNLKENKNNQEEVTKTSDNILDKIEIKTQEGQIFTLIRKENQELEEFKPTLDNLVSQIDNLTSRFLDYFSLERRILKIVGDLDVINKPKLIKVSNLGEYQEQFEDASNFSQPISMIFNRISGEIRVLQVYSKINKYSELKAALQNYQVSQESSEHIPLPINFIFEGDFTESQISVFKQSAERWSSIICDNLSPAIVNGNKIQGILINARAIEIDGPHNRLAQAGPMQLRPDTLLPATGIIEFDVADLNLLEEGENLVDVITHEIAHVLGFGTLWEMKGLLRGIETSDPVFIGHNAMREYGKILGLSYPLPIPIENSGYKGTKYDHWSEKIFQNELMTGYLDNDHNPVSIITLASLQDLGYQINYKSTYLFEVSKLNRNNTQKAVDRISSRGICRAHNLSDSNEISWLSRCKVISRKTDNNN